MMIRKLKKVLTCILVVMLMTLFYSTAVYLVLTRTDSFHILSISKNLQQEITLIASILMGSFIGIPFGIAA